MYKATFRTSLLFAMAALVSTGSQAQYSWDVGVFLGGANYLGEMGGKEKPRRDFIWDMKLSQTRWCVGVYARRKINRWLSVNSGFNYMRIQGADALSTNPPRVGRNLNFRNDMFEWYIRPEFTLFQDNDLGGRGRYKNDIKIYAFVGASVFYHNPKGQINRTGEFYALQPLTTELVDYSKIGVAIPAGLGVYMTKHRRHRIGFEFGWRTTFTDYLDDVSTEYQDPALMPGGVGGLADQLADQHSFVEDGAGPIPNQYQYGWWGDVDSDGKLNKRGDPTHNDSYLTAGFTYGYVLRGQSNFYRQRYGWVRGKKRIGRKSRAKF